MPIPPFISIPEAPEPSTLTLPGGATMEDMDLLKQAQPAFAPLKPFFDLLDVIITLTECMQAVPEMLGPPPDPTALIKSIVKLVEKVDGLLRLVPQLSIPYSILDTIDLVLQNLQKVRTILVHLLEQTQGLSEAKERAEELGDEALSEIIAQSEANIAQQSANMGKEMVALGSLMGVLNVFLGMIGGPELPDLRKLGESPLEDIVEVLDTVVETLQNVRNAIPVP